MKLGGSARVRVSNAQGGFLSHAISKSPEDGKHGVIRLLVFDSRGVIAEYAPTPYNAPAYQKRSAQKCRYRRL